MKKVLLFILPLLTVSVLLQAQSVEITSYRGAFAPAPAKQWTDNWTSWDPQNIAYPTATVNVSGVITSNTTWTSGTVYLLQGLVFVDSLVTLTIEPGTIIRGDDATANSSLVVQRGAKLMAEGTVCNPIVFTSNKAIGSRAKADWGGIILLGRAKHNIGTQNFIEGIPTSNLRSYHGGLDDNDNSGILKYVRIEYGGFVFAANQEINGLTMGSVGRGTTIDYVQSSFINDDAFEWFGGAVNCKHLVAYRCLDDDFDTDNGFSGTVQYALGIKDPSISDNPSVSTSEGFESDNDAAGTNQGLAPKTSASFYNVTQIGAFRCSSLTDGTGVQPGAIGFRRGPRIRRNSDLKIINSILMNNWRGLFVEGALALGNVSQDSLRFRNNIIAGDFTSTWTAPYNATKSFAFEDANTRNLFTPIATNIYGNDSINTCSLLTNPWNFTAPDYRPNVRGAGALVVDINNLQAGTDLTPGTLLSSGGLLNSNETKDFAVFILENGGGSSNGVITISIPKLSAYRVTVPGLTLTATNQSGTNGSNAEGAYTNGDWLFKDDGLNIIITSKAGVVISKNGFVQLGLIVNRPTTTVNGTNQILSININGGGDVTPSNDGAIQPFGTN